MQVVKFVKLKLFYNITTNTYYVQIGDSLFAVREVVALAIQDKEGLSIRRANSLKDIQIISSEDK